MACLFHDCEAVNGEADLVLAAELASAVFDVFDLLPEAVECITIHKVVVRDVGSIVAGVAGVAALED